MKQAIKVVSVAFGVLLAFAAEAKWTYEGTVYNGGTVTLTDGNWTFTGRTFTSTVYDTPTTGTYDFRIQKGVAAGDNTVIDFTDVYADTEGKVRVSAFDYTSVFKNNSTLEEFIAPDMFSIGAYNLSACSALRKVVLSPQAREIGNGAFSESKLLSDFSPRTFPALTALGGNAFDGCSALTGEFDFPEVTKFDNRTFAASGINMVKAAKLAELPSSSSYPAFDGTPITGTLDFPLLKKIPRNAFRNCTMSGLKAVGCEIVEQNGVSPCPNLETLEFSNALTNIGIGAFANCPKLKTFTPLLPAKLKTFEQMAFQNDSALTGPVVFRSADITAVPRNAFYYCTNLTSVVFKKRMTSLGETAFSHVGPSCSFYFHDNPDPPAIGSQCAEASDFSPYKTRFYVRNGRESQTWQALCKPAADGGWFAQYCKSVDYPGKDAFGIARTGYAYEIQYSWIIDWPAPGLKILLK